jgi:RNA polymerase sigma-70 factor (ECF subfamily)
LAEDVELAKAAAAGDQRAFETLVNRHRTAIYALAYKIALNEDDALDATQEVFLRLSQRIGSFTGRGTFRSWVMAITAREAVNALRRRGRHETALEPSVLELAADEARREEPPAAIYDDIERRQRRAMVDGAMHRLTPQQRAVLSLRLNGAMELQEIADQLNIPNGQVRSALSQAVSKLRSILTKERNDAG